MSPGGPGDRDPNDPKGERFSDLVGDAVPLAGRDRILPQSAARPRVRAVVDDDREVEFATSSAGERVEGVAVGVDRKHLRDLSRGRRRSDVSLDLHGDDLPRAERRVRDCFADATRSGARCLCIIHGRGYRSEGGPVLKQALLAWITTPPLAARVLAFASAPPDEGGTGATRVLLRRVR